jgi:hypothetical protein
MEVIMNFAQKLTAAMHSYGYLFNQNRIGSQSGTFEVYISRYFDIPLRELLPKSYNKNMKQLIENRFNYYDEYLPLSENIKLEESLNKEDFQHWLLMHMTKFTGYDLLIYVDYEKGKDLNYLSENLVDNIFLKVVVEMDDPINPTLLNGVEMPTEFILFDTPICSVDKFMDEDEMIDLVGMIASVLITTK